MSRLSWETWNDWRYCRGKHGFELALIRCNVDYLRGFSTTLDVVLLGFGVQLTWYDKEYPR